MKILNEKEQLSNKLDEINGIIKIVESEVDVIFNKKKHKQMFYGFLIIESYDELYYKYENKKTELKLLYEYRNMIIKMMNNSKY